MNILSYAEHWRLIHEIDRRGSVSAAADVLGLELSAVSRTLKQMEAALGFPLLDRSRRPARLSPRAKALLPYVRELVRAQDALAAAAAVRPAGAAAPSRHVRISIPTNVQRGVFYGLLKNYEESNPGIRLEICSDTGVSGLLEGVADIAFLGYTPSDEGLLVIPAEPSVTMLLASREYLRRHGAPQSIQDLESRTVILRNSSSRAFSTRLEKGGEVHYLSPGQKCRQGAAPYCLDQLKQGQGIAIDIDLGLIEEELAAGEVAPVLPGWHREPWRNSIALRREVCEDPVCLELAQLLRSACAEVCTGLWRHWYRHFGVPFSAVAI